MGGATSKGVGRALAQERLRAEIGVKMHMAIAGTRLAVQIGRHVTRLPPIAA